MDFFKNFVEKYQTMALNVFILSLLVLIASPESLKIYTMPLALLTACVMFIVLAYSILSKNHQISPRLNNGFFYAAILFFIITMSKFLLPEQYYFYWQIAVGFAVSPLVLMILYVGFRDGFFQKEA